MKNFECFLKFWYLSVFGKKGVFHASLMKGGAWTFWIVNCLHMWASSVAQCEFCKMT